eukprot:m.1130640 g.1130640  ORF g.1130640 m.1130640 type:complete len:57 (-) comp24423_c0_seq1:1304-1474(-)
MLLVVTHTQESEDGLCVHERFLSAKLLHVKSLYETTTFCIQYCQTDLTILQKLTTR